MNIIENLTYLEYFAIAFLFIVSIIIGVIIREKDIKNNSVRHCNNDSRIKLDSKKPPGYEQED